MTILSENLMGDATSFPFGLKQLASDDNESPLLKSIDNRLNEIENRLKRIVRDLATAEDQLFFTLVFSLAILLGTLPFNDLAKFFQEFSKLTPENSAGVSLIIKSASILCLLISSASRYYGVIVGRRRSSKTARALSLEFLIMGWDAFLFGFVVSMVFNLSLFFGSFTIFIAALAALIVFISMAWVEKKILSFYASRYLVFKKDVTPLVSTVFQWFALSLYIAYLAIVILASLGFIPYLGIFFPIAWMLLFILIMIFSLRRKQRSATDAWRDRAR